MTPNGNKICLKFNFKILNKYKLVTSLINKVLNLIPTKKLKFKCIVL